MNTTKRFEEATTKLYNAFNKGTLDAYNCKACAVGNLVGHGNWAMHTNNLRSMEGMTFYKPPSHKDYNEEELFNIERTFLQKFDAGNIDGRNKEAQFNGLMAVIDYLAELDNIQVTRITIEKFEEVLA